MAPLLRGLALSAAAGVVFLLPQQCAGLRTTPQRQRSADGDSAEAGRMRYLERLASNLLKPFHGVSDAVLDLERAPGDVTDLIFKVKHALFAKKPMCDELTPALDVPECRIAGEEECRLENLRGSGPSTMVYPGGKARCLNNSQPDYAFQVFPGDADKLYFLFDGGGAEWDTLSTAVEGANKTWVYPHQDVGSMRRGNGSSSPFRDYTIVLVQYCSGDLHSGNVTQDYLDPEGGPVMQMGYHNTMSAVNWALANMQPTLKSFVLSGVSAGAIGAEVWSMKLLRAFKYESARVLADSYVPVFPAHFQGRVFRGLGVCDTDLLEGQPDLQEKCWRKTIEIQDLWDTAIATHPGVGFASATTVNDFMQVDFYKLTALTKMKMEEFMNFGGQAFQRQACKVMSRYSKYPNYIFYMIDGSDMHILQNCDGFYKHSQKVTGAGGERQVLFVDWLRNFLSGEGTENVASFGKESPHSCKILPLGRSMQLQR